MLYAVVGSSGSLKGMNQILLPGIILISIPMIGPALIANLLLPFIQVISHFSKGLSISNLSPNPNFISEL